MRKIEHYICEIYSSWIDWLGRQLHITITMG